MRWLRWRGLKSAPFSESMRAMKPPGEFMMVLRNTDWNGAMSVDEVTAAIDRYNAWFERLVAEGVVTGGRPLLAGGRVVTLSGDGKAVDRPFVESKETIGGYILLNVPDLDAAVAVAKTFPPVMLGVSLEIRELTWPCPVSQRHEARLTEGEPAH